MNKEKEICQATDLAEQVNNDWKETKNKVNVNINRKRKFYWNYAMVSKNTAKSAREIEICCHSNPSNIH